MPMNSAAPRRSRMRSRLAVSRPSPLSTMKRIGWKLVSAVMSVEIGREQLTDTPSCTSAAARLRFSGVMKLSVPSWSSAPQRPQLLSESSILRTSASVGIWVMAVVWYRDHGDAMQVTAHSQSAGPWGPSGVAGMSTSRSRSATAPPGREARGAWGARSGPPISKTRDLDRRAVERGGRGRRRAIAREDVGAAMRVVALRVGCEPRAFFDRHAARRDAIGHARRQHGGAALVEHAHLLAVDDAARGGVGRVHPHVVAVGAQEDRLVVMDGVRARA